ncbi:MAG TPA: retron system putative HNH endonuclease [Candidatus Tectomicrobia bacterium]
MKRCAKSQPAPACLSHFRTMHGAATWEQFREQEPECYTQIRDITRRDQGGLCAYCELKLDSDNEQVAHFHPKSDMLTQHNWALTWTNLWLACKGGSQTWMTNPDRYCPPLPDNLSCDECKGDRVVDDLVLAPDEIPAFPRIFRFEQRPDRLDICVDEQACYEASIPVEKAQQTIDAFNLNCSRLAAARLALHRQLEQAIMRLRRRGAHPQAGFTSLVQRHLAQNANGHWPRFFTLVRWRFGQVAESYLQSISFTG